MLDAMHITIHFILLLISASLVGNEALYVHDWVDNAKAQCVTIADIKNLPAGARLQVLVMDRNLTDVTCEGDTNPVNTVVDASTFFRRNTAIYTHEEDLHGTMDWIWNEEGRVDESTPFEFHIEYLPDLWYPLKNGLLPTRDPQELFPIPPDVPRDWREFNTDTCIGWRGPMLKWELVAQQPKVYCREDAPYYEMSTEHSGKPNIPRRD